MSSSANNDNDDDFSRRLAALQPRTTTTDTDLSARFQQLFSRAPGAKNSATPSPDDDGSADADEDEDVKKLLTEIRVEGIGSNERAGKWSEVSKEDEAEIDALLEEAGRYEEEPEWLKEEPEWLGEVVSSEVSNKEEEPEWMKEESEWMKEEPEWLGAVGQSGVGNEEEEEEIVRKVKEEVEWEARHGIVDEGDDEDGGKVEEGKKEKEGKVEKDAETEDDNKDELAMFTKRFEALGGGVIGGSGGGCGGDGGGGGGGLDLPSAPKSQPGAPVKIAPKKEQGVSEIDTWCCICNEDAEYRCSGCDNDIYCRDCLYEAHTGPDAGYEERKHKWTKYVRPKKIISAA